MVCSGTSNCRLSRRVEEAGIVVAALVCTGAYSCVLSRLWMVVAGVDRARNAGADRAEGRTDFDELACDTQRRRLAARDTFVGSRPRAEAMAAL